MNLEGKLHHPQGVVKTPEQVAGLLRLGFSPELIISLNERAAVIRQKMTSSLKGLPPCERFGWEETIENAIRDIVFNAQ